MCNLRGLGHSREVIDVVYNGAKSSVMLCSPN